MSGVRIPPPRPSPSGYATEKESSLRVSAAGSLFALLDGGCSSPGRAPDCGSGGSGFETRQPPHLFIGSHLLFLGSFLWLFSLALLFGGALGSFMRHRAMPHGATLAGYRLVGAVRMGLEERKLEERKKEGAIHAPVRCVSGLGLMAFRGHLKHPCRPDMHA